MGRSKSIIKKQPYIRKEIYSKDLPVLLESDTGKKIYGKFMNIADERATELDKAIKESFDGVPFASYTLTNNNAKIKNTRKRIAELERLKETATEQTNETYNTDLFEVIENADIMRLQLRFDGKPDADTRTVLKQNGFRWSPYNGVWQRQLTDNAKFALERVIEELKRSA